jgi:hypothetical protein
MWTTSPGRWPVSRIVFSAVDDTKQVLSKAAQNFGISLSARTRSRSVVGLRSTPLHGLMPVNFSSLIAHEKIAEAAARVWLAAIGAPRAIIALTSLRVIAAACSAPQ